jgi:hypothetical protein
MLRSIAAAALLTLSAPAFAIIVYSSIGLPLGTAHEIVPAGAASGPEIGNSIYTWSQPVNEIDVVIRIGGSGETQFDARARLYDNYAPDGEPGALLWDSQPVHVAMSAGANVIQSFAVPNVEVSSATWTLEITNRTGANQAAISLPHYAAYGGVVPGYWVHSPGGWSLITGEPAFGAQMLGPGACCSSDFNNDLEFAGDTDIEDFFKCLGGDCCPTCNSTDVDCDGDAGTDADIESFFRVLAGGPC